MAPSEARALKMWELSAIHTHIEEVQRKRKAQGKMRTR